MSKKYSVVKNWWNAFHNLDMIKNAVKKKYITGEEFEEITGERYE